MNLKKLIIILLQYIFKSLSEGITDFRNKTDCQLKTLPSSKEMEEIRIEEAGVHLIREIVSSSNIRSIGYDHETLILEVEFIHGGTYQYSDVPEEVYLGLMNAGAHGSFFNEYVKRAGFPYIKTA